MFIEAWVVWLVIGLLLLIAEVMAPGIVLMFFGLGAVLTAILVATDVLDGLGGQLIVFALSSVASLLLLRRYFRQLFSGQTGHETLQDEFVGRDATVVATIVPGTEGRVEIKGANWRARSEATLQAGCRVRIVRRDNLVLWVEAS